MSDDQKTKAELIEELNALRSRIAQIEDKDGSEEQPKYQKSENTFRMVFENAPDGMLLADVETRNFRLANNAICRELGYAQEEIVNLGVVDIHPEEDLPYVVEQFEKLAHGEILTTLNIPVKRKDGSVFYADISSSKTILSGKPHIMGVFRDVTARRQAEEALKESEEKYRFLFDAVPTGIGISDFEGNVLEVNRTMEQITGYSLDEFRSMNIRDIYAYPEDREEVIKTLKEEGRVLGWEQRLIAKDGSVRNLLVNTEVIERDGVNVLLTTSRDTTAHKEAENALRKSQSLLHGIMDNASSIIVVRDIQGRYVLVNTEVEELLGMRREEILGKTPYDIHSSDKAKKILVDDRKSIESRVSVQIEDQFDAGGCLRTFFGSRFPLLDPRGEPYAVCTVATDITELKEVEDALRQSERKYRTLINNIPDVVWTSDSEGNSTFISPNVERVYGYTPQEICEQRHDLWLGRVHPDDLQRVEKAYRALLNKKQPFDVEYRIKRKDGQWIWLHDRSIATYEKNGVTYADGIFSDVTVRKVVEMSLRESQTNLALAQQIAHVGSWEWNLETGDVAWSDETYNLLGFGPGQIEPTFGMFLDMVHPDDREFVKKASERAATEGLDGRGQVLRDGHGNPLRMLGAIQDITDLRMSERRQKLRFEILEALHQQRSLGDMCARAVSLIKADIRSDAAALRIKEGDDYPYFVNDGFSEEFIEAENLLLGMEREGEVTTNPDGTAVLGCMCGVVLDGRFNESEPFFTDKGSFWTNHLSSLLESTSTADRCGATCKTCNDYGYESVALIPIKSDGQILGLLQVNAERENLFSLDAIQFLEELSILIGVAFERKKAEQALKQSEEKFRRITEQGFDVVFSADLDGTLTYASPSAERVFGYNSDEIIGRNAAEFTPESKLPDVIQQFRQVAEGNSISGREVEILRKDGSVALIELNSAPIRDGDKIIGAQASARDITERRRVENALRESEGKYRTLVESAGETITSVDKNGVFLFMNTTGAERLGGTPEDYIGKKMWDLFPKDIADRQMGSVRRVINTGKGINVIVPTVLQGQMRWYNTTIEPLTQGHSDKAKVVMIIARDIHDIKQAQDELARYREKMAHADRLASLGTLSATVAHELTQPLTVIRLSLDNLLDELKAASSPAAVIEKLQASLTEISNITSVIDRFRTFARKSSVKTVEQVNLKTIAERIVQLLGESARRSRITLQVKDMDQLPPARLNERDFEQLFFALTQNAIQAADGKRPRSLVISGLIRDKSIELRFTDDCGGIAPGDLNSVFMPFFTTKSPDQGTGLGLCIVKDIASRAGGKVSVESDLGKGTAFIITLPYCSQ